MDKSMFEWNVPAEWQPIMVELLLNLSVALPMEDVQKIEVLASRCARAEAKVREYEARMKGRVSVPVELGYIKVGGDRKLGYCIKERLFKGSLSNEEIQAAIDKEKTDANE